MPTSRPARTGPQWSQAVRRRASISDRPHDVTLAPAHGDGSPEWLRRSGGYAWRFLVILAAIAVLVFGALQVKVVLIAVFLALVVTSVLERLVTWLENIMPRALATAISLVLTFALVGGLLTYVVYSVTQQASHLAVQFNRGINEILQWLEHGPLPFSITSDDIREWVAEGQRWLVSHSGDIASTVFANAGGVFEVFTILALSLFTTIFFLAAGQKMWIWFLDQIPARSRVRTHEAAAAGWYTFSGYARGTVIIALIDGILAYILLAIVGVPLAAPLAVLVFIGAFIPLVGAPAAMVVAAVVALAANGPVAALVVTLGIAGIGQLEGHILQPLIMGRQVSLHPVVVALGVTAGTFLGGLLGAVVAIPLIAVTWAVFSRVRHNDPPMTAPLPTVREIVDPELEAAAKQRAAVNAERRASVALARKQRREEAARKKALERQKRHGGPKDQPTTDQPATDEAPTDQPPTDEADPSS